MRADRSLTLIAPDIDRDLITAREMAAVRWPGLALMAGRGDVTSVPESIGSATSVLSALALAATAYPDAAVMAAGVGLDARGYWLCANPMHFAAGLNDLRAIPLHDDQRMTDEEAAQLQTTLTTVLHTEGLTMHPDRQGSWLLQSTRVLDASTFSPHAAAIGLDTAMPRGRDASLLKRLMTEMQMLLHEHPVNAARVRRRQPEINAIWLHGGGSTGAIEPRALPAAFGDDAFLRGVYALHGAAAPAVAHDALQVLRSASAGSLAVIDVRTLDALESQWLAPSLCALRSHALSSLDLVLDRWRISIKRGDLLRFWRGSMHPAQWPA